MPSRIRSRRLVPPAEEAHRLRAANVVAERVSVGAHVFEGLHRAFSFPTLADGIPDADVGTAPAQVAAHPFAQFVLRQIVDEARRP